VEFITPSAAADQLSASRLLVVSGDPLLNHNYLSLQKQHLTEFINFTNFLLFTFYFLLRSVVRRPPQASCVVRCASPTFYRQHEEADNHVLLTWNRRVHALRVAPPTLCRPPHALCYMRCASPTFYRQHERLTIMFC